MNWQPIGRSRRDLSISGDDSIQSKFNKKHQIQTLRVRRAWFWRREVLRIRLSLDKTISKNATFYWYTFWKTKTNTIRAMLPPAPEKFDFLLQLIFYMIFFIWLHMEGLYDFSCCFKGSFLHMLKLFLKRFDEFWMKIPLRSSRGRAPPREGPS